MEVAEILNISKSMAYRLMQTQALPTVSIGKAKRVRPKDLETYIQQNLSSIGPSNRHQSPLFCSINPEYNQSESAVL